MFEQLLTTGNLYILGFHDSEFSWVLTLALCTTFLTFFLCHIYCYSRPLSTATSPRFWSQSPSLPTVGLTATTASVSRNARARICLMLTHPISSYTRLAFPSTSWCLNTLQFWIIYHFSQALLFFPRVNCNPNALFSRLPSSPQRLEQGFT